MRLYVTYSYRHSESFNYLLGMYKTIDIYTKSGRNALFN